MDVDVKDIKVGDDAVISVALPEDATGNVTVNVNGKNYTAIVKYGVASVTVPNLANGTYSVSVFYNGDDTYMPMENSTKFTVSKVSDYNMTVDIADIIKGENATITVTVPKDGIGRYGVDLTASCAEVGVPVLQILQLGGAYKGEPQQGRKYRRLRILF